jgi:ABC-2 type transport system permease protein
MILIINFGTMVAVVGITSAIGEELNLGYLLMTHIVSIPYFLAIISFGILISTIIDEKMKAAIFTIAILIGMFVLRSISLMIPDYESLGYISLTHYFNPADILLEGEVDPIGVIVLVTVTLISLIVAMLYFEYRDIAVT